MQIEADSNHLALGKNSKLHQPSKRQVFTLIWWYKCSATLCSHRFENLLPFERPTKSNSYYDYFKLRRIREDSQNTLIMAWTSRWSNWREITFYKSNSYGWKGVYFCFGKSYCVTALLTVGASFYVRPSFANLNFEVYRTWRTLGRFHAILPYVMMRYNFEAS